MATNDAEPTKGDQDKAGKPASGKGGEDESSTEHDGDDSHLHDDQKSRPMGS